MKPTRIIWHHSAIVGTVAQKDQIDAYHKERGFPLSTLGYNIGYHWLIEPNGDLVKARNEDEIGAHDTGENLNSIGICLAGNFSITLPKEAQIVTLCKLISEIRLRHKIPLTRIEPHRFDDDTECPGTLLHDNWLINEYLKREVNPALRVFRWIAEQYNLL